MAAIFGDAPAVPCGLVALYVAEGAVRVARGNQHVGRLSSCDLASFIPFLDAFGHHRCVWKGQEKSEKPESRKLRTV